MPTSRSLVGIAVAALAVTLAAGAAATTHATPGLRVQEYAVPAGTHPHDVAVAADGTVWYTAQHTGKLGRLDPKTGRRRRSRSAPARRRTASSSGPTAPRG